MFAKGLLLFVALFAVVSTAVAREMTSCEKGCYNQLTTCVTEKGLDTECVQMGTRCSRRC
jgi:hypothetical protein